MELRQLAYLVAVAEEGSFTRAAGREHVAQPGVSAQIRRLEDELGQPLFDRGGGRVTLTEAGAAVLPFARAALAGALGVRVAIGELTGLVRGHVAVGVAPACATGVVDALASFHAAHPGVEISLVEDTSARLLDDVRGGRLDLALAGLSGRLPADLTSQTVTDEPVLAAVHPGHPLAARTSVALRALSDHPLIALPLGTGLRTALQDGCAAAGVTPRIAFEAGDPRVLADLARRGLGVAMLPGAHPEGLHTVEVTGPRMRSRLELVWRAEGASSPAARALIAHARAADLTV